MTTALKYRPIVRILTVLLFCFGTFLNVRATHIAGAEISYKHISNNTYKFTLKVYRDCRECKFNNIGGGDINTSCNEVPPLQIKGAVGTNYANNTVIGYVEITRVAISDLTNTCYNTLSKCRSGSNSSYGYEMHVFEGVYDFSSALNSGYCNLDVSIGMSARNININNQFTEQNFFNFCNINLCEGLPNSSVEFSNAPQFLYLINQSNYQSLGVINKDGDSLAFSLAPALKNRTVSVSYATGFDFDHPFNFYCSGPYPCSPNLNGLMVEGFYCSKSTGDIAFTPITLNQGGVVVVECEEWKKKADGTYYLAGVTRRDVYSDIITQNNNLPKIKNKILEYNICEGQDLKIDLNIEDLPFMGLGGDSVFAEINSTIFGSTILRTPKNISPFASYSILAGKTYGQVGKHFISVKVWDNNCPTRGTASVTFIVNIRKNRTNKIVTQVKNCGMLDVTSSSLNTNIYWMVLDSNNNIVKELLSRKITAQLPSGGKYYIKSYLPAQNGFCELNQIDTIRVSNFKKPEINMGADVSVCKGSVMELKPKIFNTYSQYNIYVNGMPSAFPYKFIADASRSLTFKVLQNDGCFSEDNLSVQLFPELSYKVKNDTFCVNATYPVKLKNISVDRTKVLAIQYGTKESGATLTPQNAFDWYMDLLKPSSKTFYIQSMIQDKNHCNYKDTFAISIVEPEPITFNIPESVCINSGPLELPVRYNGYWTCTSRPDLLNGNILSIDKKDRSAIELIYTEKVQCQNKQAYTIQIKDTAAITFGHDTRLKICQSQSPFELKAFPSGGTWSGPYVQSPNKFDAYQAGGSINELTYNYTNISGCVSEASVSVEVVKLPDLNIQKSKDRVCVGDLLALKAVSSSTDPGYWYTDGNGTFDQAGNRSTNYTPSQSDVSKPYLTFTYTLQTNGICGNIPSEAIVVVRSGQVGEILKNYPTEICEPAAFRFQTNFQRLEKQYWMVNDSIYEEFDYNFDFTPTLPAGEYVVKTLVRDSTCQAMAISETIIVLPQPDVLIYSNPTNKLSREYPRLYLKDLSYCKYGHTINWYINNTWIGDSRELNFKVEEPKDKFTIKLIATSNKGGCVDSASQNFVFIPINQLYIPNAFSPDSKGPSENNSFKVVGPAMRYYKIEIFNKFGEKVYMSFDINASWDGTYKNQVCMQGDYFYKIETTDSEGVSRDYSGTVTILR